MSHIPNQVNDYFVNKNLVHFVKYQMKTLLYAKRKFSPISVGKQTENGIVLFTQQ